MNWSASIEAKRIHNNKARNWLAVNESFCPRAKKLVGKLLHEKIFCFICFLWRTLFGSEFQRAQFPWELSITNEEKLTFFSQHFKICRVYFSKTNTSILFICTSVFLLYFLPVKTIYFFRNNLIISLFLKRVLLLSARSP